MGHCYHHALSSVKKWGGTAEDYLPLHQWFDESKAITADFRHRALRRGNDAVTALDPRAVRPPPGDLLPDDAVDTVF